MATGRKIAIGLSGGVCLVLIRLVQAGFYLSKPPSEQLGGYLVAAAFVAIATIFSVFIKEEEPYKIFMQALLAPSFLIAVVAKADGSGVINGAGNDSTAKRSEIRTLASSPWSFDIFSTPAFAQELPEKRPVKQGVEIRTVDPGDLGYSLSDGALSFLGRPQPKRDYALVLGKTTDPRKAQDYAHQIESLRGLPLIQKSGVSLIRFEGGKEIFLLLGDFGTRQEIQSLRNQITDSAINTILSGRQDPAAKASAALVAGGKVVAGQELAAPPQ